MNREQYLTDLETRNKYCECPELKPLFRERKGAEELVAKCYFLKRKL